MDKSLAKELENSQFRETNQARKKTITEMLNETKGVLKPKSRREEVSINEINIEYPKLSDAAMLKESRFL